MDAAYLDHPLDGTGEESFGTFIGRNLSSVSFGLDLGLGTLTVWMTALSPAGFLESAWSSDEWIDLRKWPRPLPEPGAAWVARGLAENLMRARA